MLGQSAVSSLFDYTYFCTSHVVVVLFFFVLFLVVLLLFGMVFASYFRKINKLLLAFYLFCCGLVQIAFGGVTAIQIIPIHHS